MPYSPLAYPPFILPQADAERIVGHPLPAELFEWAVTGHRILVVTDKPRDRYGPILLPKQSQKRPARGWVISCGELVGRPWHPAGGECVSYWPLSRPHTTEDGGTLWSPDPASILGARILFPAYAGEPITVDPDERSEKSLKEWADDYGDHGLEAFRSPFRMMTDNEVFMYHIPSIRTER